MIPKRVQNASIVGNSSNLKTSIYDWDSPSSYTGTVKRRPTSSCQESSGDDSPLQNLQKYNNKQPNQRRDALSNHILPQEIVPGNCQASDERTKDGCRRTLLLQSKRDESSPKLKAKPTRLRMPKPIDSGTTAKAARGSCKPVGILKNSDTSQKFQVFLQSTPSQTTKNQISEILPNPTVPSGKNNYVTEFTELFCDFPSTSESAAIIGSIAMSLKPLPPPYREPPKPPPLPPLDQIPSLHPARENSSNEKHQQQRFGSKQQSKGLIKSAQERVGLKGSQASPQQPQSQTISYADNNIQGTEKKCSSESGGKQKSPYKGRVSELKNCISRINSRGLFSLTGTIKHNEDNEPPEKDETQLTSSNEYILYNPSNKTKAETEDDILAKPEFTSSLFKNIPVRPRKGGIPHLDNYCLFDPSVDFINEKDIKKNEIARNPSKSPPKSEIDTEEELVEEIIYEDQPQENENNYFTIEPDGFDSADVEPRVEGEGEKSSISPTTDDTDESSSLPKSISDSLPRVKSESHDYDDGPVPLGRSNIITADSSSLVRRKTLLNLAPFCTNSLRSNRSGFSIQKEDLRYRNRTIPIESNYVLFNPGPVPSKSIQYKVRKPRPISTHSDADSGFLSPCSPDELKFNPAILVLEQCDSIQGYIEIYTDWANYYLERVKSKKKVTDLSADCRDGLLLADIIEAVTSFKVPDLVKKPKSQQQMFDNVNSCLHVLRNHSVGGIETITTNDICAGRLKAVLALFFALSRFKQQSKQQRTSTGSAKTETQSQPKYLPAQPLQQPVQQPQPNAAQTVNDAMVNRQIPVPYSKTNGGTAIPLPATVLVQRRCPPDKVRPLPPTPSHTPSIPGLAKTGGDVNSSRPGSPPACNSNHIQSQKGANNGLRQPQCKIPGSPYTVVQTGVQVGQQIQPQQQQQQLQQQQQQQQQNGPGITNAKHSMLDKLKLFNKEKSTSSSNSTSSKSQVSKRTSSSSGFSSARSERSDSSLSLNDGHVSQIKPPSITTSTAIRNKDQSAKNLKQSKFLSTNQKPSTKDSLTAKNAGKKEKSPARKDSDAQAGGQMSIKSQKTSGGAGKIDAKTKMSSKLSNSKLDVRSESKQSLIAANKPPMMTTTSTGIPKPMAAIKGTSKSTPMVDKKADGMDFKLDKNDISSGNQDIISDGNHQDQRTHIVNPLTVIDSNMSNGPCGPAGHVNKLLQNPSISMSDSLHSNSTHSGGLHSNSSESSVIYRPSSESGSDILYNNTRLPPPKNPIPNRKIEFHDPLLDRRDESSATGNKFHTVPSKIVSTIYEEEKPVNVMPMRPLLRGYNSHVTLPTRGTRGQHFVNDFCESDIGQGYCSDGDALRRAPPSRFVDIDNGYMSEGSGGIHGKHFLSVMRARSQLPTTIEERIRSSRGSLDSLGTAPPSIGSGSKMELNGSPNRSLASRNGIGRDNWSKMPEPLNGHGQPSSPTSGRKDKSSPSHSRRNVSSSSTSSSKQSSSSSGRTKGVPQSFGYVKRSNGSATGNITTTDQQNVLLLGQQQTSGRTAHVSAVPRSGKIKVSGGTQTCTSDLQTKIPPNTQHRSFSLTGPGATQLSQSIRERLSTGSHSLPKPGTDMHVFQHRISNRGSGKILDGSLSDTQTYAEVKPEYSTYAMWLKHSNTASSRLSEGDSLESLQIGSPGLVRHGHKLLHRGETTYMQSPRLNRSNSIRSTKSEKMYPSMLTRGPDVEIEPYYCLPVGTLPPGANGNPVTVPWSQPTSPTPPNRGFSGPLSPTHAGPGNMTGCHRLTYPKKNDEVHGSAASLLSGGSSLYGSAEERQANEVRRLKRELADARDQVMSLYSQLSTNVSRMNFRFLIFHEVRDHYSQNKSL